MLARYVLRDLFRNPRRTAAALVGVTLGVGLFSGVLFFIDGSGASMTKRAIAPLALDMQRVIASPLAGRLRFAERISPAGRLHRGQEVTVTLTASNRSAVPANEVVIRDEVASPLTYLQGSTTLKGKPLREQRGEFPLSQGLAGIGLNIGTLAPGRTVPITYAMRATAPIAESRALPLLARISSRESVIPALPNAGSQLTLAQLAAAVRKLLGKA